MVGRYRWCPGSLSTSNNPSNTSVLVPTGVVRDSSGPGPGAGFTRDLQFQ